MARQLNENSAEWHNPKGGCLWRYDADGVSVKDQSGAAVLLRTRGEPITCRTILKLMGDEIRAASRRHGVPEPLIVMTIAVETGRFRKFAFTGPQTFRWEPGIEVRDVDPPVVGDYSAGAMQILGSTARWLIRSQQLGYDPLVIAPVFRECPDPPPSVHPLYDNAVNIDIGTAAIRQRWKTTNDDPILVAAAYNAGGLYKSSKNAWRIRCTGDHLDRAAAYYGDACAVLKESLQG